MNRGSDRLAGLGVLGQAIGAAGPVITAGVSDAVIEALRHGDDPSPQPAEPGGVAIVLGSSWATATERLAHLDLRAHAWAWLLTSQQLTRDPDVPAGWHVTARFAATPSGATPTHLVNLDIPRAPEFFARTLAPAWGLRSAARREMGRLRVFAPLAFPAFALLVCRGVCSPSWPLTPHGAPAIITLGGGATAGRTVLTYLGEHPEAVRYVKVDSADRGAALSEHAALIELRGHPEIRGAVAVASGTWTSPSEASSPGMDSAAVTATRSAASVGQVAAAQTGLPGVPAQQRWSRRPWRWAADISRAAAWLGTFQSTAADLPTVVLQGPGRDTAYLAGEVATRVGDGMRLARKYLRPVHGDFWPGNILLSRRGIAVIDWECAHVGHPLQDVLTLVITASRLRSPQRMTVADGALAALTRSGAKVAQVAPLIAAAVHRLDSGLGPRDIEDLVLSAMIQVVRSSSTPLVADPERAAAWSEAVEAVWADWQADGSPWAARDARPPTTLRVAHVLDSFSFGGAENLVVEAARHGHPRLTLRALSLAPAGQGRDAMLGRLRDAGLAPRHLGVRRLIDPEGFIRLVLALRRLDADVVHAHLGYAATLVPIAARLAGKPVVATLHHYPADLPRGEWVKERLSVVIPARLGRLLLVSASCFREFDHRHGPATKRWLEVPNGVDVARFSAADPLPVRVDLGLESDAVLWAVVAALREPKGHEDLIAAWSDVVRSFPQAHLIVAGDGPHRPVIERTIAAAGLGASVHLLGRVEDVPGLLAACDAVVSASHTEALPTGLIEAGAAGLPVVATRAGGSCDIVADGVTGLLVDVGDRAGLAAAVCRLTKEPALRRDLGCAAASRVAENFSIDGWLTALEEIYRDLLDDAGTSSRRGRR